MKLTDKEAVKALKAGRMLRLDMSRVEKWTVFECVWLNKDAKDPMYRTVKHRMVCDGDTDSDGRPMDRPSRVKNEYMFSRINMSFELWALASDEWEIWT